MESTQDSQPAANDKFESPCDLSSASSSGTPCSLALPNETGLYFFYQFGPSFPFVISEVD